MSDELTVAATADLIARDPALPLATLLDDDHLSAWLSDHLGRSVRARRRYLRYKQGSGCVVLASLGTEDVVVSGVGGDGRPKLAKALLRAEPSEVVAADLDAGLLALRPAADRHLRGLGLLLRTPATTLRRLSGRTQGLHGVEITPLAYKPHRRWVGRVDLAGERPVVVRAYRDGHADRHLAVLTRLQGSGLPVPQLLRRRGDLAMLRWVPGSALDDLVHDTGPDPGALVHVGSALARLHAHLAAAPRFQVERVTARASTAVGQLLPDVEGATVALGRELAQPCGSPPVLAHGDFSLDQVVLGEDGPQLLDLDRATTAPAALDLAGAVASLLADPARDHLAGPVLDALLAGYGRHAAPPHVEDLAAATSVALLSRATEPFRLGHPTWATEMVRLLELAESVLDGHVAMAGAA